MSKEETHQAFLNTTYKVKGNYNFDIKINSLVENANHLDSYAFITAWNPLPVILSLEENRKRNQELENELISNGMDYSQGIGISADGNWSEESFFVENISIEKANELAKKYGQLAFVFGYKNNKAALIYTK